MVIKLSNFGILLNSRPAGHEAYLAAKAYLLKPTPEKIEIDFSGVKVVTPSWLDEFLTPLKSEFGDRINLAHTENQTVKASLATISKQ